MAVQDFNIKKASGEKEKFSMDRVASSLKRAGADEDTVNSITEQLATQLHEGISTKEIYKMAYQLLKSANSITASRYKLKQAIFDLRPTGFPFERFIGAIFRFQGNKVETGKTISGICVDHEIDIIAENDSGIFMMECKFHSDQGKKCDVKTPLYIHSRFEDINAKIKFEKKGINSTYQGWVVTNTRFTKDAVKYSKCVGMQLLSWDEPRGRGIKDLIDQTGLYPITVSSLLSKNEKQHILNQDIVLCNELIKASFVLDKLNISGNRQSRIIKEMKILCKQN